MESTTIKVPVELRDRLAERARSAHTTLAGAIQHSLDESDDARFWRDLAASMDTSRPGADADAVAATLTDGLDPDEDWNDVW